MNTCESLLNHNKTCIGDDHEAWLETTDDVHHCTTLQLIDWLVNLGHIQDMISYKSSEASDNKFEGIETHIHLRSMSTQDQAPIIIKFEESCRIRYTLKSRVMTTWRECTVEDSSVWRPLWHLLIDQPRVGLLWMINRCDDQESTCWTVRRLPFHNDEALERAHQLMSEPVEPCVIPLIPFAYDHVPSQC